MVTRSEYLTGTQSRTAGGRSSRPEGIRNVSDRVAPAIRSVARKSLSGAFWDGFALLANR